MIAAPTQISDVVAAPVQVAAPAGPILDQATTSEVSVKVVDAVLAGGTGSTIAVLFAVVVVALTALAFVFRRSEQQVAARLEEAQRDNDELQKKLEALETRYETECRECETKGLLRQQETARQVERERERADNIAQAAQQELRAAVERHAAEITALRDRAEAQLYKVEAERKAQVQEFSASVESMHQATLAEYRVLMQNVTHSLDGVRQALLYTRDTLAMNTQSSFGFSSNPPGPATMAAPPGKHEQQRSTES